jgi:hypothetical protein
VIEGEGDYNGGSQVGPKRKRTPKTEAMDLWEVICLSDGSLRKEDARSGRSKTTSSLPYIPGSNRTSLLEDLPFQDINRFITNLNAKRIQIHLNPI